MTIRHRLALALSCACFVFAPGQAATAQVETSASASQQRRPGKLVTQPAVAVAAAAAYLNPNPALQAMVRSALPDGQGPNGITYIFGTDGLLRHIIMENGSGARYLMQEKSTDSIQPDEIVGPMPTVVEMTIKRVS